MVKRLITGAVGRVYKITNSDGDAYILKEFDVLTDLHRYTVDYDLKEVETLTALINFQKGIKKRVKLFDEEARLLVCLLWRWNVIANLWASFRRC